MNHSSRLNIEEIRAALADAPIGHPIDYHASVPTTMQPARALAANPDIRSGAVVVTEEQTQGRGRLERSWKAPFGRSLLSTTVLKAPHLPSHAGQLAMIAGLAVIDALEKVAPEAAGNAWLKWPNDVLLVRGESERRKSGGAEREVGKVAGILAESSYRGDAMIYALLGIGINVNQRRDELPSVSLDRPQPVSLYTFTHREVDRATLLVELCRALAAYVVPTTDSRERIYDAWRTRLHTIGRPVTVTRQTGHDPERIAGAAVDVTLAGELVVEDEAGLRHTFSAGDVSLRN